MNVVKTPDVGAGWNSALAKEFDSPNFQALKTFLIAELVQGVVFPKGPDILKAFQITPFEQVKVVILGQDPYHGPGQAHGLCFSVPQGVPPPPSLQNIFKEQERDLGISRPRHGDLKSWAHQGVLLLNATLTVRANTAGSHQGRGWERFTDAAIRSLSEKRTAIVFLLWGRHAQQKAALIDQQKHFILQAPHPSPLSAHKGFIGCGHFSRTNELLSQHGLSPINWQLPG